MPAKFELDEEQQKRFDAWFKYHWEVHHKGWKPRDMSGFAYWMMFGPTGCGDNVKVECAWCSEDFPGHELNLTTDSDDGGFIFEYDENWIKIPQDWERPKPVDIRLELRELVKKIPCYLCKVKGQIEENGGCRHIPDRDVQVLERFKSFIENKP